MRALILNSGIGTRMGSITDEHPKCMTEINTTETILSRQLRQLSEAGIKDIVITTGKHKDILMNYCNSMDMPLNISYVYNNKYSETNYIYSMYLAKKYVENDDIILMHGDMVFEDCVLDSMLLIEGSCMAISSETELPDKDFKAVIKENSIEKIGIDYFNNAVAAQPLYKLTKNDWKIWMDEIATFCKEGNVKCYAENAFNSISEKCIIKPFDVKKLLCNEIDTIEDLAIVSSKIKEINQRTVYMCFSTDVIHSGHIAIIKKAMKLGKVTVGILSDEVVASYKRFPLMPFEERKALFSNIKGVNNVIRQDTLSYASNIRELKPTYVVHGDDWREGFQKPIRDEVTDVLSEYGGVLVEFPYADETKYTSLELQSRELLSMPDMRRARLKKLIDMKKTITILEAHSGITGLIAENTTVYQDGKAYQFDGMWISSLCDSTAKGKPDIEVVDMSSRMRTVDDIMEVTTKPIILDGDTGGQTEHFVYTVRTLERIGVSAVIIEDKTGLKKNSLFGTEVKQTQDTIEHFCKKIMAGKRAQKTSEFMIIARIESLILEKGMDDALSRAFAYVDAGADGIMIHSRRKTPDEVFEFVEKFREKNTNTPIVVVPTSYNSVTEEEFKKKGVNIIIYANQLTRSGFPAMQNAAKLILENHRAKEADDLCMPIKEILTLIPDEI